MAYPRKIVPLSEFRKKTTEHLVALEESPTPLIITLRGRGVCVVQSLEMYAQMDALAQHASQQLRLEEALKPKGRIDFSESDEDTDC